MAVIADLLRLIERNTGKFSVQLEHQTISARRNEIESKLGKMMLLVRLLPFIGRGSVMGAFILSHSEAERQLNRAHR